MTNPPAESQIPAIAAMDRQSLILAILCAQCSFPNDLSEPYLNTLSLERLRHVYMALLLHRRKTGA